MWHKLTPLFSKTLYDRIALMNNHWGHYPLIQQIEKGVYNPPVVKKVEKIENYYINFPAPPTDKIVKIMEYNGPTNFYPLVQKGVDVHTYKRGEHLDTKSQSDPDNVFDFSNSSFIDKRKHGMDNKAYEKPREFESKIFSFISKQRYIEGLNNLETLIIGNIISLSPEKLLNIRSSLKKLKETCDNLSDHQIAWAEAIHHFPDKYIPAIRVPKNFSLEDLNAITKLEIEKSTVFMKKISDFLFKHNIPENDYIRAIELFENSFMQELLSGKLV